MSTLASETDSAELDGFLEFGGPGGQTQASIPRSA